GGNCWSHSAARRPRGRLRRARSRLALPAGRLHGDGRVVQQNGGLSAVKIAIDPVWDLPGIAERFRTMETNLLVRTDRGDVSRVGDAPRYASLSASNRGNDSLSLWRGRETGRPADTSHLPCA